MPTATSMVAPPVPESSSTSTSGRENSSRPSNAIQKGADLLLELFDEEKAQFSLIYRESLEKRFGQFQAQAEAQMASADSQLTRKTVLLGNLSTQYDRSMQDLEATRNELQQVRAEYAKLMASVNDAGLVYTNGTLHFNDTIAKIISDFWEGTRLQDMIIPNMNPNFDMTTLLPPDHNIEASSKAIKPSDLFAFLSDVVEKSQWYAHGLNMHQQRRSASFLEGSTSRNDAALQLEVDSLVLKPGVVVFQGVPPTDSPSLPENKAPEPKSTTLKRPPSPAPSSPSNKLHKSS